MPEVYIGIGSNIDPENNILKALELLNKKVEILKISNFYKSKAVGSIIQSDFINAVILIKTKITPINLKYKVLRKIESNLDRRRTDDKNSPRQIDLDILLYDDKIIDNKKITVPDPSIIKYNFIFIPLLEISPELVYPGKNQKIKNLIKSTLENKKNKICDNVIIMITFTKKVKSRIEDGFDKS